MSQKLGSLESTRFMDVWFNIHVLDQCVYIYIILGIYIYIIYHVQFNVAKLFTEFTFTIMKCQVKHGQGNLEYVHVVLLFALPLPPPKKYRTSQNSPFDGKVSCYKTQKSTTEIPVKRTSSSAQMNTLSSAISVALLTFGERVCERPCLLPPPLESHVKPTAFLPMRLINRRGHPTYIPPRNPGNPGCGRQSKLN